MSRVDVIIPCYNYGHYLENCVQSVLSQEGVDVRVLIIDDASPDNTPEVAAKLMTQDERIEYRRHAHNLKHIATYNEGLAWATGAYTLLLSADDLLTPGALNRAAGLMDAHPEVVMTYGKQIVFAKEPLPPCESEASRYTVLTGPEFIEQCCRSASNPVNTPTAFVRTSFQKKVGDYRIELPHTADMDMWLRFAAYGSVGVIEANQAFKRMHQSNMQHGYLANPLGDLPQRRQTFDGFFAACSAQVAEAGHLHRLALDAMGLEAFWIASRMFDQGQLTECASILNSAVELNPGLKDSPQFSRLAWKRRLGTRAWQLIRPFVDTVRGANAALFS